MNAGRIALALVLALLVPGLARAESLDSRKADARTIARGDAADRDRAIERTCALGAADVDAIRERIADIRAHGRPTLDAGYDALGEFAVAAGGTGPADARDLVSGIRSFPTDRFTQVHANAAERYCLIRSLERVGTAEALTYALPLLAFDIRAMRWQARHLVRRNGRRSVAMLIRGRGYANSEVILWSGWGLVELGIRDSGGSVQEQDEESLIAVLRAYPAANHLGGMPVVASFVDDERAAVRAASRAGLAAYGDNAVWEIRRLHQTRLGRDPGARPVAELLRSLGQELDRRRDAPLVARAQAALAESDDAIARRLADALVADAPAAPATRTLAPLFFRQAAADAEAGRFEAARSRLAIAQRLGLSDEATTELSAALERRRLEARGIFEIAPESDELPDVAASGSLARRRTYARYGFVVSFLLLAGPSLWLVARILGKRGHALAGRGAIAIVNAWNDGGRERTRALVARAVDELRGAPEKARTFAALAERTLAKPTSLPEPRARAAAPAPAQATVPAPAPAPALDTVAASVPAPAPAPVTAKVPVSAPRPAPAPTPSGEPALRRRDRPSRRAAASVDLFTSASTKRRESA